MEIRWFSLGRLFAHYDLGQAPGCPALIFLLEEVRPGNWGTAAIAASVLPVAGAAVVFHALAGRFGIHALWPTVAFIVVNSQV